MNGDLRSTKFAIAEQRRVELRRPQVPVLPRSRPSGCGPRRGGRDAARAVRGLGSHAAPGRARARPREAGGVERDLGQAWATRRGRMGARPYASVSDRAVLRQSEALAPAGRDRRPAPRAPRRLGLPARAGRGRHHASRADPRRGRRLPGDARATPHRPERSAAEAAAELRADVNAGRLDPEAVEAVLGAAGHRVARRREGPRASPRGRSTSSGWLRAGSRTRRSPSAW